MGQFKSGEVLKYRIRLDHAIRKSLHTKVKLNFRKNCLKLNHFTVL